MSPTQNVDDNPFCLHQFLKNVIYIKVENNLCGLRFKWIEVDVAKWIGRSKFEAVYYYKIELH